MVFPQHLPFYSTNFDRYNFILLYVSKLYNMLNVNWMLFAVKQRLPAVSWCFFFVSWIWFIIHFSYLLTIREVFSNFYRLQIRIHFTFRCFWFYFNLICILVKRQRAMVITDEMKNFKAFQAIRQARAYKRLHGIRYVGGLIERQLGFGHLRDFWLIIRFYIILCYCRNGSVSRNGLR